MIPVQGPDPRFVSGQRHYHPNHDEPHFEFSRKDNDFWGVCLCHLELLTRHQVDVRRREDVSEFFAHFVSAFHQGASWNALRDFMLNSFDMPLERGLFNAEVFAHFNFTGHE